MHRGDAPRSLWQRVRFWLHNHLRLVWNFVMMAILFSIFLFATLVSSAKHQKGTIIENIDPSLSPNPEALLEEGVQKFAKP